MATFTFLKSHDYLLKISDRVWTKDVRKRTEKRRKRKKGEHVIFEHWPYILSHIKNIL